MLTRFIASDLRARSLRALALSSGVRGGPAPGSVIGWRRLRSASLRLGVGRPLAASAGERGCLISKLGPSGLCAPGESWAVLSVARCYGVGDTGIA